MERIITLVESLNRPGTAEVVEYLKNSNFARIHGGGSHHRYKGGLVDHSLEVYENMKRKCTKTDIPEESIIVCSIFHDLGKTKVMKGHPAKSVAILNSCGFELKEEEIHAIENHHRPIVTSNVLYGKLHRSDMESTGDWQAGHSRKNQPIGKKIKKLLMHLYSKMD